MELDPKYDHYDFPTMSPVPQSGHPGHLTQQQQAQVHQLRLMLESEGYTDRLDTLTLQQKRNAVMANLVVSCDFYGARKFDVNKAKDMLSTLEGVGGKKRRFIECEKWRRDTKLDEVVPTWTYPEKEAIFKYYPQYYHKTDKDGRPLYIEQLGGIDLQAMYKITTGERMLMNLAVEYERLADQRLPACSRMSGQLLETCCTIMDLKGITLTKAPQVYSYVKQASGLSQNYYPERLGHLYLVNVPWGFSTVWGVIKSWLDPVTVAKFTCSGSGYQNELLKQVPAENLPKYFGGTCECEGGCQFSDMGPWRMKEWARPAKWELAGDNGNEAHPAPSDVKEGAPAQSVTSSATEVQPAPAAA